MSLFVYLLMVISSILYLVTLRNKFYIFFASSISGGLVFTSIALITGALWGKNIWGTYWIWDARLTSEFILFIFYLIAISIIFYANRSKKLRVFIAVFIIIGTVFVITTHFSVVLTKTLHQKASVLKSGPISIQSSMLSPLWIMVVSYLLYYLAQTIAWYKIFQYKLYSKVQYG